MVVVAAARVEAGVAAGAAGVGLQVGGDCQLGLAVAAEDGFCVPFGAGPRFDRVIDKGFVAIFAGVIVAAAF